ncbi:hypothetical protein BC332_03720 [Capsicum chinense]|nr:hypothetical protein BC332_03720 [Capsicum chinense]
MGMGAALPNTFVNTKRRCSELSMSSSRYGESSTTSAYLYQKVARFESQLEVTLNALKNYMISNCAQNMLSSEFGLVVVSFASLDFASFFVGYLSAALAGFSEPQRRVVGMKNFTLGVVLATSHFSSPAVALPATTSAIILNFSPVHEDYFVEKRLLGKYKDFGLSRLSPNDASHVSTTPQGTAGYVDPEYHECYQFMTKLIFIVVGLSSLNLISACC